MSSQFILNFSSFEMNNIQNCSKLNATLYGFGKTDKLAMKATPIILEDKKQLADGGAGYFLRKDTAPNETYWTVYYGIFRALFQVFSVLIA